MDNHFKKQLEEKLRQQFRLVHEDEKGVVFWKKLVLPTSALATLAIALVVFNSGVKPDLTNGSPSSQSINQLDLDDTEVNALQNILGDYDDTSFTDLNSSISDFVAN